MYITCCSIKPRAIVVYDLYQGERRKVNNKPPPLRTPNNGGKGLLRRAAARLRTSIDFLIYTAKWKTVFVRKTETYFRYKINFITLTLSSEQIHDDRDVIKSCLSPFLNAWQHRRDGLLYVWKAEVQDNGNIHFHIVSNAFYHYEKLRRDWNRYQNKLGYVDNSNVDNPNSTDVHALQSHGDVAAYLTSYMTKKDDYKKPLKRWFKVYRKQLSDKNREVVHLPRNYFNNIKRKPKCKLWGASKPILGLKFGDYYKTSSKSWQMLDAIKNHPTVIKKDFCAIFPTEVNGFTMFPEFKAIVDKGLSELIEIQRQNVIKESIEEL